MPLDAGAFRPLPALATAILISASAAVFEELAFRGVLQTLEADGTLLSHEWEQGDALVFLSHKCAARAAQPSPKHVLERSVDSMPHACHVFPSQVPLRV